MVKKTKKIKDRLLSARVDEDFGNEVIAYTEAADILPADLVRKSIKEYMLNHPVKRVTPDKAELNKPGKE